MDHTITALTAQKKNPQRVNVFLDGDFAFGLQRIVAAWLEVGQKISDEKISNLKLEDQQEMAYQKALNLLSYRLQSKTEMAQKLSRNNIPEEVIEKTIERLQLNGLMNDDQFAKSWVENRTEMRPRGRRALAYELRRRGIDTETIDSALAEIDEEELAYQAAARRAPRIQNLEWNEFRLKLTRFLNQRGFSYETSSRVVTKCWQEIHQTENLEDKGLS